MKMFRNYDGNKSSFGDISVNATVANPDNVSAFAGVRTSDSAITVIVINKQLNASATVALTLANSPNCGAAQAWQLTSGNNITRLGDLSFNGNILSNTVPAQSVTLFVLPTPPRLRVGTLSSGNTFDFWVDGQANQHYVVQWATDLFNWTSILTNTPASNSWQVSLPATNRPQTFYRAKWVP